MSAFAFAFPFLPRNRVVKFLSMRMGESGVF